MLSSMRDKRWQHHYQANEPKDAARGNSPELLGVEMSSTTLGEGEAAPPSSEAGVLMMRISSTEAFSVFATCSAPKAPLYTATVKYGQPSRTIIVTLTSQIARCLPTLG